jgi:hypothetical protein
MVVVLHYRDGEIVRRRYTKKVFDNLSVEDFLYHIGETSMEVSTIGNVCPLKKENKLKNLSIKLDEEGAYALYELNPKRKPYRRFCSCTGDLGGKGEPLEKKSSDDDRQYVLSQTLFE